MEVDKMHLKIMVPSQIIVNTPVSKVIAEAENGSFCLLPHHIDFVAVLVPGILIYESGDEEQFLAVDEGVLVKNGYEVLISVLNAVQSDDLGLLEQTVREEFNRLEENEKMSRSALEKLEADFVRRFIELQEKRL